MMGKLLNGKITGPSFVFASGVMVVLSILLFFVHMQIDASRRLDKTALQIRNLKDLAVRNLAEFPEGERGLAILEKAIEQLYSGVEMKNLFAFYPEINPGTEPVRLESKKDISDLYSRLNLIEKTLIGHGGKWEKSLLTLFILLLFVIFTMFLLLGINQFENYRVLHLEQKRNETNSKLYDQLEKERSLIAFELHDDIAQKLAVIKRYFSGRNSIDEHMILMENYATEIIKRVRYLSRMLRAPDNPQVSFSEYLETLFSDFNVLSGYRLNRKTIGLNALKLTPFASLHIYRIIQEVLTNSRIHSEATEIELLLVYSHPTLTIKYKDNGKGFDPYLVYKKGIGLDSISYRIDLLKGDYRLKSAEGEGTEISIDIPVELCEIS